MANDLTPEDEANMKTQYKHQVHHNEWKYRQLFGNINNPELFDGSPLINANSYPCADKPSISFNQLKSKYGYNDRDVAQQQMILQNSQLQFRNQQLEYQPAEMRVEDMDQDYIHVPEEHEEDVPLRIKASQMMDTDQSPVRIAKIDFQQFMNPSRA